MEDSGRGTLKTHCVCKLGKPGTTLRIGGEQSQSEEGREVTVTETDGGTRISSDRDDRATRVRDLGLKTKGT